MKNQALLSLKDKSRKLKCRLLQFLFGALRAKEQMTDFLYNLSSTTSIICGNTSCLMVLPENWQYCSF